MMVIGSVILLTVPLCLVLRPAITAPKVPDGA
jgi:hypothetical protein